MMPPPHRHPPSSTLTLADLARPAVRVDPTTPALDLDRRFMGSRDLGAVVITVSPPALMTRDHFQHEITGPWGYGRALHERRSVGTMKMPSTLRLPGTLSALEAAEMILAKDGDPHEYVLVTDGEDPTGIVPVPTVMRWIAEQYAHRATHDPLSGLENRAGLLARLEEERQRSDAGTQTGLLFLDLDHFKVVNDSLGHASGDELLVELARRLTSCLRRDDLACRLGGDEFVVLLHDIAAPTHAVETARRLLAVIGEPVHLAGRSVRVTGSLGVAVGRLATTEPEELLRRADLAMYEAKRAGRARLHVFEIGLGQRADHRFELDTRLRRAVHEHEFRLHYQPLVDLTTGEVVKLEALIRWDDPGHGLIAPNDFIPLAEDTGLIVPIGEWVLRQACTEIGIAAARSGSRPVVAVNVSARQLAERDFESRVKRALADTGMDPQHLCLELTESIALTDVDDVRSQMLGLIELGVGIALDDFGSGHASLGVLRSLPFSEIKLAGTFLANLDTSPMDRAVACLAIELAHTLGLTITAEGIETDWQREMISSMGCDLGQGYLFARPQPLESLTPVEPLLDREPITCT